MILNENKSTPFRIIEPKKFHHAQQIPVSLSNQQIPILSREDYRNNNVITLSNQKNLSNEQNISTLISERQLNQKEFRQSQPRSRNISDTDSSYLPVNMAIKSKSFMLKKTTSESGISDLDMNEKCICCPYGYHIDVDFVTFLNNFGEKNFNKQIKKINQKRNENIQKSMEYVIDEVEKIKQMNELSSSTKEPMDYINRYEKIQNSHNQTIVPNNLKKTIKQIDRFINHDGNFSNIDHDSNQSCRLPKKSIRIDQIKDNHHYLSNSSLPSENSLLKTSQSFNLNQIELGNTPRRSYSSCAEPISRTSNKIIRSQTNQRRCLSNRTSPIRSNFPVNSLPFRHIHDARRSYSTSRRTQSQSPIEKQSYKREIKINLSRPQNEYSVKEHICNDEYELKKKTCKNSVILQENSVKKPITNSISMINPIEVQEEVLLNLFSCNNSDSLSSESSESLVEIEQNLKINETYEKSEPIIEYKKENKCPSNTILEKRLIELEKKLQKIPELEIKNNILLEEKKLLLNQLLCRNKVTTQPQQNIQPPKVYRSIGCDSLEKSKRDVGISVKSNTRDFGLHVNEPSEKIAEMETVITNLKDQLKEQTLIIQQTQAKPITRDVAVMHVVDKVEEPPKPKPEYRDVAIHHSTVDENKILVEKQSYIINDYMKEIEQLQIENSHLSANLQELIKKHSKHVVTRGTYAPEQPLLYSIGINTKNISTRDVQVMYTPKSRDVCLSTDQFIHTRDVSLGCNIEDSEIKTQLDELNLIKKKYEQIVQENLNNIKSYRDVNILCRLDQKDCRDVSLGCNMQPVKDYRDVSLTCDIDKETKNYRDVSIGVQLDSKPEQKDANVYVNITESITRPVMKDSSSMAEFEDQEKIKLLREIEELKKPVMKKNAYVSVDFNTRLMNNLLKNNSSGTELIEKNNKQINTDQKTTREISIGNNFCYFDRSCQTLNSREYNSEQDQIKNIALERDKLKIINENLRLELIQMEEKLKKEKIENKNYDIKSNDFNNSTSISTVTANINCFSDSNISQIKTSSLETDPIKIKRQSEFEHHRIQKTEKNKRTIEDTVKLSASVSNKYGDKATEMASWSNKSEINYDRNEVTIPIVNEQKINYKPPIIQNQLFMTNSIENDSFDNLQSKKSTGQKFDDSITEKVESKNPKSILKQSAVFSSSKINKSMGKALTFGENEILETEIDYGHDEIFDKSEIVFDYTTKENENLKESQDENENILLNKHDEQKNIDKKTDVQILEKIETEVFQEPKSLSIIKDDENSSNNDFELELELHIACAILNDSLYEPLKADKNKVAKALNLIQQDWFKLAAQKESNPVLVEEHLNAFYTRFSNLLLERIVNMADLNHNTALHYSVSTGNFEIVNLLLDTKVCDVNAQNKAGYTSIMLAAVVPIKDDFERMTLKRLFSEGNVNIKSIDSGQTALMLAVRHGNKDTVALLLESSADCNAQDKEGSTALMAACEHGHIDIVRLLLDNTNCDPDIKDNDGETAFDIAKNKNRNDIIVLLYAHSTKLRSHHPAIQFSKTRPRIGSNGSTKK